MNMANKNTYHTYNKGEKITMKFGDRFLIYEGKSLVEHGNDTFTVVFHGTYEDYLVTKDGRTELTLDEVREIHSRRFKWFELTGYLVDLSDFDYETVQFGLFAKGGPFGDHWYSEFSYNMESVEHREKRLGIF